LYATYQHSNPLQCCKTSFEQYTILFQEDGLRVAILTDKGNLWTVNSDAGESFGITAGELYSGLPITPSEVFDLEVNQQGIF